MWQNGIFYRTFDMDALRALALGNSNSTLFYHSKKLLYHTILRYFHHPKTLFLLKYYFFIFLYYFFPTVTFFQTWFSPINLSKPITTHIEPHTHKHKHKPLNLQQSHTHTNHQTSWSQQRPPHLPTKPSISKAKPLIRNPSRRFETQPV